MRLIKFADNPEKTEDAAGKIAKLDALYKAADTERRKAEQEWFGNAVALAGLSGEAAAADVLRFRRVQVPASAEKASVNPNLLYFLTRQAAASGVENAPRQEAIPATSEIDDIEAASLATDLIDNRYDADHEYDVRLHEELWRMTCGISFRHTYWDTQKDGYGLDGQQLRGAGDIETRMITPFNVHVCPWVDSSSPRPWYIISDVRDTDEIGDIYGEKVEAEDIAKDVAMTTKLLSNIVTGSSGSSGSQKHAVVLKRFYHEPTPKYPNGKVWAWAGGKLLSESELPEGAMPFVELIWFPMPGRIYPYPFLTPLVGLQREITKTLSQLVELKNRQLRGDIILRGNPPTEETESPIKTDWDSETGQKRIWLDSTVLDFQMMQYNLNTADAQLLMALKWENMQRIAGLHDPSTGESAKVPQTAYEISVLKEADTAGLALFRNIRAQAQSKIERQKIVLAKNHYTIPRFVRVVGEGKIPKADYFFGAELRNTDDVRPRPIPLLTEGQKQQIRMQLSLEQAWDFSGSPTMIANKVKKILNSGLPNGKEEIESMIAPLTINDIWQAAGMSVAQQIKVGLQQGEIAGIQAGAMMEQAANPEAAPMGGAPTEGAPAAQAALA